MRKEIKIGNTNYMINGSYRAVGDGISLSAALFRLMERDLQGADLHEPNLQAVNFHQADFQTMGAAITQPANPDTMLFE